MFNQNVSTAVYTKQMHKISSPKFQHYMGSIIMESSQQFKFQLKHRR